jgi:hypothetical protein
MEEEADAFYGMARLGLKRLGSKINKSFDLHPLMSYLPCFGLSEDIDFVINGDYISFGFEKKLSMDEGCPKYPKKNTIRIYSEGFFRAEKKRE